MTTTNQAESVNDDKTARRSRPAGRWLMAAGAAVVLALAAGGIAYATAPAHEKRTTETPGCRFEAEDSVLAMTEVRVVGTYTSITQRWRPAKADTSKPGTVEVTLTLERGPAWDPATTQRPFVAYEDKNGNGIVELLDLPPALATTKGPITMTYRLDAAKAATVPPIELAAGVVDSADVGPFDPDDRTLPGGPSCGMTIG